ncbi:MAG: TetR/AcrR family transcriptional regulator [Calditrichia bacterium]
MPRIKTGNKRERILEAALTLFSQAGYQETSIDQIAAHAGIATGTIYLYFENKEDILKGILKRFLFAYDSELRASINETASAREKLEMIIGQDLQTILEAPHRARLFLFEMRQSAQCLTFLKERLISRYEYFLNAIFRETGGGSRIDIHLTAVMLSGILENVLYDWVISRQSPDISKIKILILNLLF